MEVIYTLKNIVLRGYKVLVLNSSIGYEPITGRGKAGCIILPVQLGYSKKVASLAVYPLWITA
nr:MAG TPA: hypothetical protein [Caudoviricetes sp.]